MSDTGRTAFVTGSARNIGRAVTLALAEDGFNVVINGSKNAGACEAVAEQARALGVEAVIAMGDIGVKKDVKRIAAEALDRFGGVDVLVNNAATRPAVEFLKMTEDQWRRVLSVNLHSVFFLAQAFLPGMVDRGWGRIVNFTGMQAMHGYADRTHVSASKHAVWGMAKSLAKAYGPNGVTVNVISPGPIRAEREDPAAAAHTASLVSRVPVGRLGEAGEVAAVVAMLVSDGGAFVNGQMIQVNGGAET